MTRAIPSLTPEQVHAALREWYGDPPEEADESYGVEEKDRMTRAVQAALEAKPR